MDEFIIKVKVKPKSKREYIKKISQDQYEIAVKEPPEKGKANKRVIEIIAEYFHIPKAGVSIIKGHTSRNKMIKIPYKKCFCKERNIH